MNLLLGRLKTCPRLLSSKGGKIWQACSLLFAVLYSHGAYKKEGKWTWYLFFFLRSWPLKAVEPTTHRTPISSPPHPSRKNKKKKFKGFSLSWVLPLYGACSKYHTVTNHPCYNILSSEGSHSDSTKPLWCHGVDGVAHFDLLRGELWRHLSASAQTLPSPHLPHPPSGERL